MISDAMALPSLGFGRAIGKPGGGAW